MMLTIFTEYPGRWGEFDLHIWWHWLILIAVLFGGSWVKTFSSKSDKPKDEDESGGDRSNG